MVVNMQNTQEKIHLQKMKVKFNVMKTRRFVWTKVIHNRKKWRHMFDQQFRCMVGHLWCSDRQVGGWWAGEWAGSHTKFLLFTKHLKFVYFNFIACFHCLNGFIML